MSAMPRQPFCACGQPIVPPWRRYCSVECRRAVEYAKRRVRDKRRNMRDRAAYSRARYARIKADPVLWARERARRRAWTERNREAVRRHHREFREREQADPARLQERLARDRERQRRRIAQDPDGVREQRQRYYQRLRADPVAWARMLETHRMGYRLRAERDGRPVAPVPVEDYAQANRHWRTPAAPVLAVVDAFLAETGLPEKELAALAGVSPRLLYRLHHEHQEMLTVATADRLLLALGSHLDLLEDS